MAGRDPGLKHVVDLFAWPLLLLIFFLRIPEISAGRAERINYLGTEFIAYWVDLHSDDLSLRWRDSSGQILGTFDRLRADLGPRASQLKFAINAGIFSTKQEPLGLHIERFKVLKNLNLGELEGGQLNFYMKPNGVFYVVAAEAGILESKEFAAKALYPSLACQSGPLLVQRGKIHPLFQPGSTNLHWRSGVGISSNNQVVFAISKSPLCFHDFARLFRDRLGCENALYLDGDICAIYLPELGFKQADAATRFAGMFAVVPKRR